MKTSKILKKADVITKPDFLLEKGDIVKIYHTVIWPKAHSWPSAEPQTSNMPVYFIVYRVDNSFITFQELVPSNPEKADRKEPELKIYSRRAIDLLFESSEIKMASRADIAKAVLRGEFCVPKLSVNGEAWRPFEGYYKKSYGEKNIMRGGEK